MSLTGLPWEDPVQTMALIERHHEDVTLDGRFADAHWVVMWCAGGGNVAADADAMATETELVAKLASWVQRHAADAGASTVLSFASSGGAIWSGTEERVLSEDTPPTPWHPYGKAKLEQERLLAQEAKASGWLRVRLARISNLYGPEPENHPPSGLPGHLIANVLRRIPTSIYVPMDTQRDYIYVDHAADMMVTDAMSAFEDCPGTSTIDLVAAGSSHTIAAVVSTLEKVLTRRVPLTVGFSPHASRQPRILSFRSRARDLQRLNPIGLEVGLQLAVDTRLGRSR